MLCLALQLNYTRPGLPALNPQLLEVWKNEVKEKGHVNCPNDVSWGKVVGVVGEEGQFQSRGPGYGLLVAAGSEIDLSGGDYPQSDQFTSDSQLLQGPHIETLPTEKA